MTDRYFFDKRQIKHGLIKYGIAFLVAFPLLILVGVVLNNAKSWIRILIYIAILLTAVILSDVIDKKLKTKKLEQKQEIALREKQQRTKQQTIKSTQKTKK